MEFTTKKAILNPFKFLVNLYTHGFKIMSKTSKALWVIAIIKLVIMFGFLKIFFFKNHLSQFETQKEKIEHISKELTKTK